jgi:hypothetical protein
MALTKDEKQVIIERAHTDKVFCKALLRELIRLAVIEDPDILERAMKFLKDKENTCYSQS